MYVIHFNTGHRNSKLYIISWNTLTSKIEMGQYREFWNRGGKCTLYSVLRKYEKAICIAPKVADACCN